MENHIPSSNANEPLQLLSYAGTNRQWQPMLDMLLTRFPSQPAHYRNDIQIHDPSLNYSGGDCLVLKGQYNNFRRENVHLMKADLMHAI